MSNDDGIVTYQAFKLQASSPDEVAIVNLDFPRSRPHQTPNAIRQPLSFDVLDIFPFTLESNAMGNHRSESELWRDHPLVEGSGREHGQDCAAERLVRGGDWEYG